MLAKDRLNWITTAEQLRPDTKWEQTIWAHTAEESLVDHHTKARLCVAMLLPFHQAKIDWDGFVRSAQWMRDCAAYFGVEMVFVLNADTGYIFNLSLKEYAEVLQRFRAAFPDQKFIAGTTAADAGQQGFLAERYWPMIDLVQEYDNCEVMIMTSRTLNELDVEARRDAYYEIAEHLTVPGIVHALEPAFVPWATAYEPWLLHQLALHPKFTGGKVSTLSEPHFLYWTAMSKALKLDFAPHSGDDYGIGSAIRMGMPLLIGAGVSACPLICAAKQMWLVQDSNDAFDVRVYKLMEVIQSLEDQVFRLNAQGSAAAYKHSTACVLKELELIASTEIHPNCVDHRGDAEQARMREAMIRPSKMAKLLDLPFWPHL